MEAVGDHTKSVVMKHGCVTNLGDCARPKKRRQSLEAFLSGAVVDTGFSKTHRL